MGQTEDATITGPPRMGNDASSPKGGRKDGDWAQRATGAGSWGSTEQQKVQLEIQILN